MTSAARVTAATDLELLVVTSPGPAPEPSVPAARAGTTWSSVLDALECDVLALERALDHDDLAALPALGTWPPPEWLGLMPRELTARAAALQARQIRALDQLALAIGDVRGTLAFLTAATDDQHSPARAFLDQAL